jgi:glycogen phosphorylase
MNNEDAALAAGAAPLDPAIIIIKSFLEHLEYTLGKDKYSASDHDHYNALAYSVRDILVERWLDTQQAYYNANPKRVYYLSMEFLMGRTLENALINLGMLDLFRSALDSVGYDFDRIIDEEQDAGLGNGGLGRLAACFLDSLATLAIPSYGYGIRYEYGIFRQKVIDGAQVEVPDNWLRYRNPWEFDRQRHLHRVAFYGRVVPREGDVFRRCDWIDTRDVMALAYDTPIPGYGNSTVNTLRLWSAKATREFDLKFFNEGDYIRAVEEKDATENISRVLYPADNIVEGRELRLKQEYFLSAATLQDVMERFRKGQDDLRLIPEKVAIQLNDTHPALAIPELMRILVDDEGVEWEEAWRITVGTFAYTNHTVLPEALEKWPVWMLEQVLPRHMQIIYEINLRFLEEVRLRFPGDEARLGRMSVIEEDHDRKVRMAHLAIIGSHSVNGVSSLHTEILINDVFRDFHDMFPDRFNNKTNGITQRRWLRKANPLLADLVTERIGDGWLTDLYRIEQLTPLADDPDFRAKWRDVKRENKVHLAEYILKHNCVEVDPESLFDCQVKRIHEYKRQLLNVLHVIALYHRIKDNGPEGIVPRTVVFAGKAAPSYTMAKLIIRLITGVGKVVNSDPDVAGALKVVFLANYGVTLAEKIFPAADLSEQISTAGTEASGTGNMKFALNGALTIGTLDGANVEMLEEIGSDNIFIFGRTANEIDLLKTEYRPRDYYENNPELRRVLDAVSAGAFSPPDNAELFRPLVESLLDRGDRYFLLADYASYVACQEEVSRLFLDQEEWTRRSILNTACTGRFSSDRTIAEYARDIWDAWPVDASEFAGLHRTAKTVAIADEKGAE